MTQLLLLAMAVMGALVLLMGLALRLMRNAGGAIAVMVLAVLAFLVASSVGLTVWHRIVGRLGSEISSRLAPLVVEVPEQPTPLPGPSAALLAAERQVAAAGYQVVDPGTYRSDYSLHVLIGAAGDGSAVPRHQQAFFFASDGRLLGQDAPLPSASLLVLGQGPSTVALAYQLYAPGDADCCATLGKAAVRFRLDRGRQLLRLDPLPPDAARRACCPTGPTPPTEPLPRGSRLTDGPLPAPQGPPRASLT
jgi:LppP/LprE lipoprotein